MDTITPTNASKGQYEPSRNEIIHRMFSYVLPSMDPEEEKDYADGVYVAKQIAFAPFNIASFVRRNMNADSRFRKSLSELVDGNVIVVPPALVGATVAAGLVKATTDSSLLAAIAACTNAVSGWYEVTRHNLIKEKARRDGITKQPGVVGDVE